MELTYSKEVLKHLKSPKNMGVIKNPSGEGMVGNKVCGDIMKMYIKVDKKVILGTQSEAWRTPESEDYIKDIKFQTLGCGAAIATSSVLTTLAKGKTIKEALKISKDDIIKSLGGLPTIKIHCSVLADQALQKAVEDYLSKTDKSYIDKVALIYILNKKILVSLSKGKDTWYIPGGKREKDETDQETLIREIKEEVSVDIKPSSIQYYGIFEAQAHGKPNGVIVKTAYYLAKFSGSLKPSSEIEKIDFFDYSQKDLTSPLGKLVFDDLKTKGLIE